MTNESIRFGMAYVPFYPFMSYVDEDEAIETVIYLVFFTEVKLWLQKL